MSKMIDKIAKAIFLNRWGPVINCDDKTETFWPDRVHEINPGLEDADDYRAYARIAVTIMMKQIAIIGMVFCAGGFVAFFIYSISQRF